MSLDRKPTLREELARLVPIAVTGIVLGITSAFIVLSHPVEPLEPPLPVVDGAPLARIAAADRATYERIFRAPLPLEVRALGNAFLSWNAAAASGMTADHPERQQLLYDIRASLGTAQRAYKTDEEARAALRDLRAYQTELFMSEIERRARTGVTSTELQRLAGALLEVLVRNGWADEGGGIHVPSSILRTRYKLHWTATVYTLEDCERAAAPICYGLTSLPLEPVEVRALLAFLVAHPVVRDDDLEAAGSLEKAIDRRRVVYLDRLVSLDRFSDPGQQTHPFVQDYPVDLARGAMLFKLGQYEQAELALRKAAAARPQDMRARNWWLASVQKLGG